MGAKKKGKGKKKGKKGASDDLTDAERNFVLQAEIESLQMRLVRQQEMSNEQVAAERDLRAHDKISNQAVEDEKKRTFDIVADMTRQFKATQDELMTHEQRLNQIKLKNDDEIAALTAKKQEIVSETEKIAEEKDTTIADTRKAIDDM